LKSIFQIPTADFADDRPVRFDDGEAIWHRYASRDHPFPNEHVQWWRYVGRESALSDSHSVVPEANVRGQTLLATETVSEANFGWPLRSLRLGATDSPEFTLKSCWRIPIGSADPARRREVILPTGLIWPNFGINCIFYAAIIWLLMRGPAETRRRLREWRGRCSACGYPRGQSTLCTECGADLSRAWGVQ
jgi:hypothetical protein